MATQEKNAESIQESEEARARLTRYVAEMKKTPEVRTISSGALQSDSYRGCCTILFAQPRRTCSDPWSGVVLTLSPARVGFGFI
jgi:hypothetical protein